MKKELLSILAWTLIGLIFVGGYFLGRAEAERQKQSRTTNE